MKLILYTQYINNIDTSKVVRRYANQHSAFYSPCKTKQHYLEGTQHNDKSNVSNSFNITSPRHCSSMVLKEDGKVIYGKKLLFTPIQAKACQDLTMSTLYKEDMNDKYNQNFLNYESNIENLKPKHLTIPLLNTDNKDDIYLSDNQDSTFSLCNLKTPYSYDDNCDDEKDTEISQDFQYFYFKDHNSLRSSDSGLADITIPVTQQSPLPPTETSSSNSENLCKCSSSLHINSCIFEDDSLLLNNKASLPLNKGVTFRSELYAHWWLKKKLQGPPGSCDSGKILIYI